MKTVFIDFDGTICFDRFWRSLHESEYRQIQEVLFHDNAQMVADWMRGDYTSELINQFVAKKTNIDYSHLWYVFEQDCRTMCIDEGVLELIQLLRDKYHVVLITGNMDCFDRFTVPSLHLQDKFDTIVNSYNEKQLKTDNDGETFLKYLRGPIKSSFLIEDSIKSCEIFDKLGGTALQVTNVNSAHSYLQRLIETL